MNPTHEETVRHQVTDLLITRLGLEEASLTPEATFDELELDSLALVEFSLILKEHFNVPVSEDDINAENTIDDVVMHIAAKTTAQDPVG